MDVIRKHKEGKLTTADVRKLNNLVVCLMVLVAVTSITWSVSMHILSSDFHYGIIGVKIAFCKRNLTLMNAHANEVFKRDLDDVINDTYALLEMNLQEQGDSGDNLLPQQLIESSENRTAIIKPKKRKLANIFQFRPIPLKPESIETTKIDNNDEDDDIDEVEETTTPEPKIKFQPELDKKFLSSMMLDVYHTRWYKSSSVQFIYDFPFLSEIVAIIWTAMCLIFQSHVHKKWGLPRPWQIVLPSMVIFTLMTLGNFIYMILANGYLKTFCNDLRSNLTRPDAISCGQAVSILRPLIRDHEFKPDVYLNLFRISYIAAFIFWLLALMVMILRFALAIDFQLVDVKPAFHRSITPSTEDSKEPEFTEVLLYPAEYKPKLSRWDAHKSEDDFQSAKSQQSEVATPLLENLHKQTTTAAKVKSGETPH